MQLHPPREETIAGVGQALREQTRTCVDVVAGCLAQIEAWESKVHAWVSVDRDNLLSNAIKFGQGQPIEITVEGDEHTARFTIRDHGIGVPPEDQARLFERFHRGTGVHEFGGTGFGLFIVHTIVDALGGTIRFESAHGAGARFAVELPKAGPQSALSS